MSIQIVNSSPQAAEAKPKASTIGIVKYPFDKLQPGQSFTVPLAEANLKSLRTRASQVSIHGKRFVVVVHEALEIPLVEVARVDDGIETE